MEIIENKIEVSARALEGYQTAVIYKKPVYAGEPKKQVATVIITHHFGFLPVVQEGNIYKKDNIWNVGVYIFKNSSAFKKLKKANDMYDAETILGFNFYKGATLFERNKESFRIEDDYNHIEDDYYEGCSKEFPSGIVEEAKALEEYVISLGVDK